MVLSAHLFFLHLLTLFIESSLVKEYISSMILLEAHRHGLFKESYDYVLHLGGELPIMLHLVCIANKKSGFFN
jgi:hypothetical protein